ncbi:uncharacterized protein EKO05_0000696 [Ascochyta rabiei]|uniref:Uncharacterized protein n=1 Tax=Didymella rabiei TaxID=5454 RepID=A0A163LP61_DIDRA|nr:uncharacterized protein EKO05_0000696 [Ascochyta rabiei]KZM27976.1 hypothetical protein ST47_g887 [Ascochyta rabiei]UPX10020.1 hypothetical protein EKO05_0000696 [Ascochyta rabiei]
MSPTERTPLLGGNPLPFLSSDFIGNGSNSKKDIHQQFCLLVGVPPSNGPKDIPRRSDFKRTLYGRAVHKRNTQNATYLFTAALSNTLLLTQVVLGAALTALGASESSHILITVFGALNTIIAGLVAYLKSRGQPMRARMFRDDLDRVVDEMENSEVMWLGIQQGVHGYDEIAIEDTVSVRSEVARLTRLLDKAVRSNTMNDPDMYMNAVGEGANAALRARPIQPEVISAPESSPSATGNASGPANAAAPAPTADPDASPASAPPKQKSQPSSPPPELADEQAEPVKPVKEATTPIPAPSFSSIVAVDAPPKIDAVKLADKSVNGEPVNNENDVEGTQAGEGGETNGEGSQSASTEEGDDRLVKKGEQNLDGV